MVRRTVNTAVLAALLFLASSTPADVAELLDRRLLLMGEVAAHKWAHGRPIEDLERERAVLVNAEAAALRHGLEVGAVRELFRAQMAAAKEIQAYWFDRWSQGHSPAPARDLVSEIRPQLLQLGEQILGALARDGCCTGDVLVGADVTGLSEASSAALSKALLAVQRYPDRLTQIRDSRVLRIGTTGDYAPFSYRREPDSRLAGIDVDLARALATSLHAEARFVGTSWPTLSEDLVAGRYDIAMSGVSRTAARERIGLFSHPYHFGGKTAIGRCENRERYSSWESIDQPGVRVIVNPGGTNERFLDDRLQHADKIVHEDNVTIFERIVSGDADVMITDRIEVDLQSSRHAGVLCPTMTGTLNRQEKAYLLPRDDVWQEYVNEWLKSVQRDGTLEGAFGRHLAIP